LKIQELESLPCKLESGEVISYLEHYQRFSIKINSFLQHISYYADELDLPELAINTFKDDLEWCPISGLNLSDECIKNNLSHICFAEFPGTNRSRDIVLYIYENRDKTKYRGYNQEDWDKYYWGQMSNSKLDWDLIEKNIEHVNLYGCSWHSRVHIPYIKDNLNLFELDPFIYNDSYSDIEKEEIKSIFEMYGDLI
jgi:hypothetical protein